MGPSITAVETSQELPEKTQVVIIGGGIIGLTAALNLAERNIPVVVLEKGHLAGEQSSRNLGWIRKTNRHADDVPLAQAADNLWANMAERTGCDVGYKQAGIMFVARTPEQMSKYENWLQSVSALNLDSQKLTNSEISERVPGNQENWHGGVYTPSDGRAEPTKAASAIAKAAIAKGAIIVEQCAVRTFETKAGRIDSVITEKGAIQCEQLLVAGGMWSRRFLANMGISLPTLPVICSVFRSAPMQGPTDIAVGAPDFSFRKHQDGGFIITQRGKVDAPLTLDHLRVGFKYLQSLFADRDSLNIKLDSYFWQELKIKKRWQQDQVSPFETYRTLDPAPNEKLNQAALTNLRKAWPVFDQVKVEQSWAGMIDITPDSQPVIGPIAQIDGLFIATGFSGHGFGTSPAAGQLAADLIANQTPIVDPAPYRFERF